MADDILQDRDRLAEYFTLLDCWGAPEDVLDPSSYLASFGVDFETAKAVSTRLVKAPNVASMHELVPS